MSTTFMRVTIRGTGMLVNDGLKYDRQLIFHNFSENEDMLVEEISEKISIGEETLEVKGISVNGDLINKEEVEDSTVMDSDKFEERWEDINLKWTRIFGLFVPTTMKYKFGH